MAGTSRQRSGVPAATTLSPEQHRALCLLLKAHDHTHGQGHPPWNAAVKMRSLLAEGLTDQGLLELVCWRYLEHTSEAEQAAKVRGIVHPFTPQQLSANFCFLLTNEGLAVARGLGRRASDGPPPMVLAQLPHWNAEEQCLSFAGQVVKQFQQPAPNQELVLATFQECGWAFRVDNPFPRGGPVDWLEQLHNVICRLNSAQKHALFHLQFGYDNEGKRIHWQPRKK